MKDFKLSSTDLYLGLIDAMGINVETNKMKPTGPVGIKPRSFIIETAYNYLVENNVKCTINQVSNIFIDVDEHSKGILVDLIKPLPGVKSLLYKLKENGIPTAIY